MSKITSNKIMLDIANLIDSSIIITNSNKSSIDIQCFLKTISILFIAVTIVILLLFDKSLLFLNINKS